MICIGVCMWYLSSPEAITWKGRVLYVCNCNGIRERDVLEAIEAGACRPSEVFRSAECRPQCARCVCDVQDMIKTRTQALAYAAE